MVFLNSIHISQFLPFHLIQLLSKYLLAYCYTIRLHYYEFFPLFHIKGDCMNFISIRFFIFKNKEEICFFIQFSKNKKNLSLYLQYF